MENPLLCLLCILSRAEKGGAKGRRQLGLSELLRGSVSEAGLRIWVVTCPWATLCLACFLPLGPFMGRAESLTSTNLTFLWIQGENMKSGVGQSLQPKTYSHQ